MLDKIVPKEDTETKIQSNKIVPLNSKNILPTEISCMKNTLGNGYEEEKDGSMSKCMNFNSLVRLSHRNITTDPDAQEFQNEIDPKI